jgi:hypothetical protein
MSKMTQSQAKRAAGMIERTYKAWHDSAIRSEREFYAAVLTGLVDMAVIAFDTTVEEVRAAAASQNAYYMLVNVLLGTVDS